MASTPISASLPLDPGLWESTVERFVQAAQRRREHYVRLARRVAPSQEEAEDIVQEALMRAFRNLPRFRGEAQMTTWLQTIVQNAAREWLREQRGHRLVPMERETGSETVALDFPDHRRTPEQEIERDEMHHILMSEIGNLSSVCREAIRMCAIEGASQEDTAAALEVSVAAIKARVFSAKRHLRDNFRLRGVIREN